MDFSGFDSSIILILRDGIPRPMGDFPESLTQAMLVGVMLVGRLGVIIQHGYLTCTSVCGTSAGMVPHGVSRRPNEAASLRATKVRAYDDRT